MAGHPVIEVFRRLGTLRRVPSLSPAEAQALVASGALLLDVRSAAERRSLRIPGSTPLPLNELPGRIATLPPGQTIVCHCASGVRSAHAARLLTQAGLEPAPSAEGSPRGARRACPSPPKR